MRLNGRTAIMRYLGRPPRSTPGWYSVLLRYGAVIRVNYPGIKTGMRGYWALTEELDAIDRERSLTAWDAHGKAKLVDYVTALHSRCQNAKAAKTIR